MRMALPTACCQVSSMLFRRAGEGDGNRVNGVEAERAHGTVSAGCRGTGRGAVAVKVVGGQREVQLVEAASVSNSRV